MARQANACSPGYRCQRTTLHKTIWWCIFSWLLLVSPFSSACTLESCEGVNLLAAIKRDLEPWRLRGGIKRKDVDEAESWRVHRNQFTRTTNEGWMRVTIASGRLYATHLGAGFGSRDGVYLLVLLELLKKHRDIEDVDFVLSVMDKSHVEKARWPWRDMLPFTLSFSQSPDHLDVPIPDPSFWAWPEKAIRSQWELLADSAFVWPWEKKAPLVHWRGGLARSGGLRKKLASCAHESSQCASSLDIRAAGPNSELWEPPMGMCRFKVAVFAQGEGFTSSKHRTLGCGSLPVFLEYNAHDTYYGRFLTPGVHYKRVRYSLRANATDQDDGGTCVCGDLDRIASWASQHEHEAKGIGAKARLFAEKVLGKPLVEAYLVAVLKETASLQRLANYDIAAVLREVQLGQPAITSPRELLKRFALVDDERNRTEAWERREGPLNAAVASMEGRPCPANACAKCCGHASTRENPSTLVRSPCGKKRTFLPPPELACAIALHSDRDPWGREFDLQRTKQQQQSTLERGASSFLADDLASAKQPAWKRWQAKQQQQQQQQTAEGTGQEPPSSGVSGEGGGGGESGGVGERGFALHRGHTLRNGPRARKQLKSRMAANQQQAERGGSQGLTAAMGVGAVAGRHEQRWAEKYHKPNGPGPGEFRNKHGTKRDPYGEAAVAGGWANAVVTQKTHSDPLNGLRSSRTQHD